MAGPSPRGLRGAAARLLPPHRRAATSMRCAAAIVLNGVVVAGFGVVDAGALRRPERGRAGACSPPARPPGTSSRASWRRSTSAASARRSGPGSRRPRRRRALRAWSAAARLPLALLRRPSLYAIGAVGAAAREPRARRAARPPRLRGGAAVPGVLPALRVVGGPALPRRSSSRCDRCSRTIGESLHGGVAARRRARLAAPAPAGDGADGQLGRGRRSSPGCSPRTPATSTRSGWPASSRSPSARPSRSGSASCSPTRCRRRSSTCATRRAGSAPATSTCACRSSRTDETGELAASFNAMVAGLGERERLREAFGAFVDPALTERVLAEGTDLRGEEVEVSVLFLDVRGFTTFAERAAAHEVVAALNELYEAVVPVILRHGGHANKFIGDGLLAVFGAPERHADHAARAVAAAREIAAARPPRLGGELRVGVGVNSGRVVVGTIGGGGRRDFTVIGDPVNTAARVEAATRVTGDDVLDHRDARCARSARTATTSRSGRPRRSRARRRPSGSTPPARDPPSSASSTAPPPPCPSEPDPRKHAGHMSTEREGPLRVGVLGAARSRSPPTSTLLARRGTPSCTRSATSPTTCCARMAAVHRPHAHLPRLRRDARRSRGRGGDRGDRRPVPRAGLPAGASRRASTCWSRSRWGRTSRSARRCATAVRGRGLVLQVGNDAAVRPRASPSPTTSSGTRSASCSRSRPGTATRPTATR